MALKVKPFDKSAGGSALVKPGKRLWLTKDRKRLVGEGHRDAATLYCANEEHRVPREEYERLIEKSKPDPKAKPKAKKATKAKE